MRIKAAIAGVCVLVVAAIPYFVGGYHDRSTCVLCRAVRTEYVYLGQTWRTGVTETACTRWYREHVEPTHDHVWVRGGATALRNLYGQRFGAIDRDPAGKAIWWLRPEDQLAIYEHLPPTERRETFLKFVDPEVIDEQGDYALMRALKKWQDSGFSEMRPNGSQQ